MGPRYADGTVPAILAAGSFAALAQAPVMMVLVGLNAHGRASVANLVAALCSVGLVFLTLGVLQWGLAGAAMAVTLPLTIINVAYLPFLACQRIQLDLRGYFWAVACRPAVCVIPFAISLAMGRLIFWANPMLGLVSGGSVGLVILATLYWRYVATSRLKAHLFSALCSSK